MIVAYRQLNFSDSLCIGNGPHARMINVANM